MEKKLQVKNLQISFRTANGKVQAVRDISFDLNKGETLAIVGESGSGKSVTSKAILGILAGNSIIEGGEIIYDGKDLLKIAEEDFHKIRGDKIAMIFQDPMSSLNPIVKIGRQLTEAMILKGKARQRESRTNFNSFLRQLEKTMVHTMKIENPEVAAKEKCQKFDKFEYKHLELESAYNIAYNAAKEGAYDLDSLIFEIEKNAAKDLIYRVKTIATYAFESVHKYVVDAEADEIKNLAVVIKEEAPKVKKGEDSRLLIDSLTRIRDIFNRATERTAPNFFAMGYYLSNSEEPLDESMSVEELNVFLRKYLDDNFMLEFIEDAKAAVEYSASISYEKKAEAVAQLTKAKDVFGKEQLDRGECSQTIKTLAGIVYESIDKLSIQKDSLAYTFIPGLKSEVETYFKGVVGNVREKKRYEQQKEKLYKKYSNKSSEELSDLESKITPPTYTDLELKRTNILHQIERLVEHYNEDIANRGARDYQSETIAIIDYLKAQASGVVHKVTKKMAKNKALKLMEEVGISQPRIRFNQYPFEFSGGMRQRIVIAIALAADPDILICDEPTTALDVTIQSQILELINEFKAKRQLSVIFITHDLGVVANMADRIAVMYAGKIVEEGTSEEIFYDPLHPYTWALLSSMPDLDTSEKLDAIPGTPPNMIYPPVGDAFAARNKYALKIDFEQQPPMFDVTQTHRAATWLLHPNAPKIDKPKIITDRIARMKAKHKDQQEGALNG